MYALTTENPPRAGPAAIVLGTDSRRLLERADGLLHGRLSRGAPERPPRQRRASDRERQTPIERPAAKPSGDEPRGEGRPGSRRVDYVDGDRLRADDLIAPHREAAALSELHGDDRAVFGQRLGRDVHIVDAGDRADLDRVREQHVGLGQKVEQTAVPVPRRIPVRIDRRRRTRLMRLIEEFQQVRTERLLKVERRDMHVPGGRQHRTVDRPVVRSGSTTTPVVSTPCASRDSTTNRPNASSPTMPANATLRPSVAAPRAAIPPEPPSVSTDRWTRRSPSSNSGSRSAETIRSGFASPRTNRSNARATAGA